MTRKDIRELVLEIINMVDYDIYKDFVESEDDDELERIIDYVEVHIGE